MDFKFWIAHSGWRMSLDSLSPELTDDAGEDFADSFAQALLFPEAQAAKLRADLQVIRAVSSRITCLLAEAGKHVISPSTVCKAVEGYKAARNLPKTDFGQKADS